MLYRLVAPGVPPVTLAEAKAALKLPAEQYPDDGYVTLLVASATETIERHLGRDVRANVWTLYLDEFDDPICLARDPVDSITSVGRLVSGVLTVVAAPTYYLKSSTQSSELLLAPDQEWPSDQDDVEHAVQVTFQTRAHQCVSTAKVAIQRVVAYLYENRGDCDPAAAEAALYQSGAAGLLQYSRIQLC
jgi:uncharacterized phiE125 gp8 family phage protein